MEVPLAALWVFDYRGQTDRDVTAGNGRSYQLQAISGANKRLGLHPAQAAPTDKPTHKD
jgi:hypothetical protein